MPTITVEGPLLAVDKKRRLVKGLGEVAAGVYDNIRPEAIVVLIKENEAENVGVGGELLADRRPEGAGRKDAGRKDAGRKAG
jgi:4-oxalocrotonate tautomerase